MQRAWRRRGLVWLAAGLGLVLAGRAAPAQPQGGCTFTDSNGKTVFWPNCQPPSNSQPPSGSPQPQSPAPAPGSSAAKNFPYPGDAASPKTPGTQTGSGGAGPTPAASRFPFPGDDSSGGAQPSAASGPPNNSSLPGSGGSGSAGSGSGDSSSSSSDAAPPGPLGNGDTDPAAAAAAARRAAWMKKEQGGIDFHQTRVQREVEDLKVASFYEDSGNYRGAYLRARDAVSIDDDDAQAHLALAEAARRIGKLDEAEAQYKKCLSMDPVPKVKKAAQRALREMTHGG